MQKLITVSEFKDATGVNPSIPNADIAVERMIEAAQLEDIRGWVGDKLYWDMINNPTLTTSGRDYAALLAETDYIFDEVTYTSPGLKKDCTTTSISQDKDTLPVGLST